MVRQRVVPIRTEGDVLVLGVIDAPSSVVKDALRRMLPSLKIRPVRVEIDALEAVLRQRSMAEAVTRSEAGPSLDIVAVLRNMVAEGASDLHLSAGQRPRWRIDGAMTQLPEGPALGPSEVLEMLGSAMTDDVRQEFEARNDTDFAYAVDGVGRFRVNVFRDLGGVGAVLRHIPQTILSLETLGMPSVVQRFCKIPKGLVLVTGPTGSGKSTTLAAMIDFINRGRPAHIISLEDPVEFVHESQRSLVNQREVGTHTESFSKALRAALREDPDIVLVGEMRDLETVKLGIETANTGHLVFGTLHTSTAVGTVDRIIDMFPAGEQNQVRTMLAESLKGVVAQTLCRRIGGGRVAAVEILVVDRAVSAMIRAGKMQQVPSAMQTGGKKGNQLLNPALARLVREGVIERGEAIMCAVDKTELAKLLPPG
jgi:twitching motility protein PilT